MGEERIASVLRFENTKTMGSLEDLGLEGRVILKWNLKNIRRKGVGMGLFVLE